jgi:tetratricopeptide (TPR) repeat protein
MLFLPYAPGRAFWRFAMRIMAKCNACGFVGSVREKYDGKTIKCRKCQASFVVGSAAPVSSPVSSTPAPPEEPDSTVKSDFVVATGVKPPPGEAPAAPASSGASAIRQGAPPLVANANQTGAAAPPQPPPAVNTIKTSYLVVGLCVVLVLGIGVGAVFLKLYLGRDAQKDPGAAAPLAGNVTESPADDPEQEKAAPEHVNRGIAAFRQNDVDRAIAEFTEAIRLQPSAAAHRHRATSYLLKGDGAAALADANKAVQLDSKDALAYSVRASAYLLNGKHAESVSDSTSALALDPNLKAAYFTRGDALLGAGRYEDAISDYTAVAQDNEVAFSKRAHAYLLLGNKSNLSEAQDAVAAWEKAIIDCNQALRLNPDNAAALETRGRARLSLGKTDKALADADALLRLNSKNALAYQLRGLARDAGGDLKAAIADFTEAFQLNPADSTSLRERGIAYFYLEDYKQAAADLTAAIDLHAAAFRANGIAHSYQVKYKPLTNSAGAADAEAYYYRGRIHFTNKNYDAAIADFSAALKADPNFAKARYHRSLAAAAKHRTKRAA